MRNLSIFLSFNWEKPWIHQVKYENKVKVILENTNSYFEKYIYRNEDFASRHGQSTSSTPCERLLCSYFSSFKSVRLWFFISNLYIISIITISWRCRRRSLYLPWKCEEERHSYEVCLYKEYERRRKIKAESQNK